jgi:Flp pilus assembly protein CpaB
MFASWRGRLPRIGRWPRLALAGVCLLLAAANVVSTRGKAAAARPGAPVVIATRDLPAGRVLGRADLAVVRWPQPMLPRGVRSRLAGVVGRRLSGPLTTHEPVTGARLLGRDATTGLANGMTAVPVTVADPRLGDLVHAGDRVDLLAAGNLNAGGFQLPTPNEPGGGTPVASAVRVLSVLPVRSGTGSADDGGTELVVATDTVLAERIVRLAGAQAIVAVGIPP